MEVSKTRWKIFAKSKDHDWAPLFKNDRSFKSLSYAKKVCENHEVFFKVGVELEIRKVPSESDLLKQQNEIMKQMLQKVADGCCFCMIRSSCLSCEARNILKKVEKLK